MMEKVRMFPVFSIMVVDDEENVLNSIYRLLRSDGCKIVLAKNAEDALQKLLLEPVDVLISDQKMPGISGLELMKRVKNKYPSTIRIILTGHVDVDTILEAVNEGEIYRFLLKPWNNEDLRINVRCALEKIRLEKENELLKINLKEKNDTICFLEKKYPGITKVVKDVDGAVILD